VAAVKLLVMVELLPSKVPFTLILPLPFKLELFSVNVVLLTFIGPLKVLDDDTVNPPDIYSIK
jgi:hypothetical protein